MTTLNVPCKMIVVPSHGSRSPQSLNLEIDILDVHGRASTHLIKSVDRLFSTVERSDVDMLGKDSLQVQPVLYINDTSILCP